MFLQQSSAKAEWLAFTSFTIQTLPDYGKHKQLSMRGAYSKKRSYQASHHDFGCK